MEMIVVFLAAYGAGALYLNIRKVLDGRQKRSGTALHSFPYL